MCHAGAVAPLGLRLDTLENLVKGSQGGPVVEASNPAGSELVRRLKGISQPRMPMTGPPFLSEQEIALFEDWIAGGLKAGIVISQENTGSAATSAPAEGEPVSYLHVAPIFATRCAKCHTREGLMGPAPEGYLLTSYDSTLASADRARVVPGSADASELVRRIRGQARPRMPHDGPPYLTEEQIALIEAWVNQGARNAQAAPAPVQVGAEVRLHGRLGVGGRLDGLPLAIGPSTRMDKSPRPGDYVEVRGRLGRDGEVIAERIRRR
jgi:mono/diheme cytochrome c family protein